MKHCCRVSLKNLWSGPQEVFQELTHSKNKDSNINLDRETSSEISDKETGSARNTKISENEKQESVTKKDLCGKLAIIKPELTEIISRHVKSQNQTNLSYSAKVMSKQQKMYHSATMAKTENLSSRNETQYQILLALQKRSNYQKSVSGLHPKDVGVCISSATMHKRTERNTIKQMQNKQRIFETKIFESKKPLTSELPKQHKIRMAPNGENKPLLDILAQRTQTVSATKLDSCVKIEDMFENLREHKNELNSNHKTVNKQNTVVEPKRILQNISGPKPLGGKLHQLNEYQRSKKVNKHSNQKRYNEDESRSHKTLRKHQNKSKRKKNQQIPARSESEEDLHAKLSCNMALISGSDWHIFTDCIDVSNVKVVDQSNIYQDYNSYVKGLKSDKDDNPDSNKQKENDKTIQDFHSDFLNDLINGKGKGKNLSHLTVHDVNSQNRNFSNHKLASVDESPETLKMEEILKNNDWNDSFDGRNTKQLNVLPKVLSFHRYTDFNKDLSESENVPKNLNSTIIDIDSKYETDFECQSTYDSDCPEEIERLSYRISNSSPDSLQIETAEVNQENLDSVVEELLNYSTSPICLEKRLSNISLPESESILFRSLKHQKDSPFHVQYKSKDSATAAAEEGNKLDLKENFEMSVTKMSFNKSLKNETPQKCNRVDVHTETGSLSQVQDFIEFSLHIIIIGGMLGWLVSFYGISTFVGYLMSDPFLYK